MTANTFSGDDGDFLVSWRSLTFGGGTRTNKQLPAPKESPAIPERSGSSGRIVSPSSSGGSVTGMALAGAKLFTSTDGIFTLSFPESVEVVVDETTLVLPAVSKTP